MIRTLIFLLLAVCSSAAQQPLRFSLPVQLLDLTNSVALPGNTPIPLSPTNQSLEIVNWTARATNSAEFVLRLSRPYPVGSVLAYDPGEIFFMVSNRWQRLPAGMDQSRSLQLVPLPPAETIEALKFVVPARGGHATLPFVSLLPIRAINIAPQADVSASSTNTTASTRMLVDGAINPKANFSSVPRKGNITPESPEWIQLTWKQPQAFRGVAFLHAPHDSGLGRSIVQIATTSTNAWQSVNGRSTLPGLFCSNEFFVAFGSQSTRALRISTTSEVSQIGLGEIMVIRDLGQEPAPRANSSP